MKLLSSIAHTTSRLFHQFLSDSHTKKDQQSSLLTDTYRSYLFGRMDMQNKKIYILRIRQIKIVTFCLNYSKSFRLQCYDRQKTTLKKNCSFRTFLPNLNARALSPLNNNVNFIRSLLHNFQHSCSRGYFIYLQDLLISQRENSL